MFRIFPYTSRGYWKTRRSLHKVLNEDSFSTYSVEEISALGQNFNSIDFENYKRYVLNKWIKKQAEDNSEYFISSLIKAIRHLDVHLSDYEVEQIETLRNRLLTKARGLKELDYPYAMPQDLDPNAKFLFNFSAVTFSREVQVGWLKKTFRGDLFIFKNYFFLSKAGGRETSRVYYFTNISEIIEFPYAIKIVFRDETEEALWINFRFNEIIFIALKRIALKFHKKAKMLIIDNKLLESDLDAII